MTDDRRQAVRRVFVAVADLAGPERDAALAEACGDDAAFRAEVEALVLAEAQARGLMGDPTDDTGGHRNAVATLADQPHERNGQTIDRYKLLDQIGEGGFGTVWAAEQREPVQRRVALKIIKLGMDTRQVIARFEAERQALAMLDHPHIAKVLDAGATDTGRPYFVMELVRGEPITEYCDKHNLSVKDRLDLFQMTCNAVQHAHTKGIIHRDIKPSNVLVTLQDGRPVPKVIDFGIAKATDQKLTEKTIFTEFRQFIGTPEYMSPEQAEMSGIDIDTRSDIYSLGVLLYELLTGTTPFASSDLRSAAFGEIQRIIREETPHKPSTRLSTLDTLPSVAARRRSDPKKLGLVIRGDLDWIVMKALEKDRTRRYETANAFAADIQRHRNDEPVTAGPPSTSYKLRKFMRRYKGQVLAASVIGALLALGVVGTGYGLVWALQEKQRADEQAVVATTAAEAERTAKLEAEQHAQRAVEEAHRAEAAEADALARAEELELVAAFQAGQLSAIEPEAMGANLRRSLLEATPEAERDAIAAHLASINFTSLALTTLEENIFERTIEAIDTQFESQPLVRARLLQTVADTSRELGLLDLAMDPQERALAIRREQLGDDQPDTLISIGNMGVLLQAQGELAEAEPYYREALEQRRRLLGNDHPDTLLAINNIGFLLWSQGRHTEAEPFWREALDGRRRMMGDDHPDTLLSIGNMGVLLQAQGKLAEAEAYYREALEKRRRVHGNGHPDTLIVMNNLGNLLQSQDRLAEAEPLFREVLESRRRVLGDDHPSTLNTLNSMGVLLDAQGKRAEAEPYYREALDGRRRVLGDDHPDTLVSIANMATLLDFQGRPAEAEPYYRQALEVRRRVLGDDHPDTLVSINNLGALLRDLGRLDEAATLGDEAVRRARESLGEDHWHHGIFLNSSARTLVAMTRYAEAEERALEAHAVLSAALGAHHDRTQSLVRNIVDLYSAWHEADPDAGHDQAAAEWRAKLVDGGESE